LYLTTIANIKKGIPMTNVLVKHKVKDYLSWKAVFDGFADFRKSSGEKSYRIMQPKEDPNDLTLLFEWDNLDNAQKFMKSPELKSAMQKAGVAEEPNIQFLNEVDEGTL
jgi:quinol monooxygenase YgiN